MEGSQDWGHTQSHTHTHTHTHTNSACAELIPIATGLGTGCKAHNTMTKDTAINMEEHICTHAHTHAHRTSGVEDARANTPGMQVLF